MTVGFNDLERLIAALHSEGNVELVERLTTLRLRLLGLRLVADFLGGEACLMALEKLAPLERQLDRLRHIHHLGDGEQREQQQCCENVTEHGIISCLG